VEPAKFIVPALFIWILAMALTSKPPPSIRGAPPVETTYEHPLYRTSEQVDSEVVAKDRSGPELGRWLLDDGQLYGPVGHDGKPLDPEDAKRVPITLEQVIYHPLWAPGIDLGTFAGYRGGSEVTPGERFETGLRFSPVRVLYGTLSPDLAVGRFGAGVGCSVYPPRSLGRFWRHWGVGAWYLAPYDSEPLSWCIGLTFSTVGR
jgi:hypothetical protein